MANWGFTLEDASGNVLSYLTGFADVSLSMPLNAPATLSGAVSHELADMTAIYAQVATGAAFLRAARDGTTRFYGVLSDMQTNLEDGASTSLTFHDLAGVLAHVPNYTIGGGRIKTYYKRTPAWTTVVDELLAKPSSLSPIPQLTRSGSRTGHVPSNDVLESGSGKKKIKTNIWKPQATSVLETLQELSGFADGIEWYVENSTSFKMAQTLGSDKSTSVQFQYGDNTLSNVQSATVQYQPPLNNFFWTDSKGTLHRSPSGYLTSSISSFGDYTTTFNSMARRNQSDDDRASSRARSSWRRVLEITAEPLTAPSPWTAYFLGDTVGVRVKRDGLSINSNLRINAIDVSFDESGVETAHKLAFEVL